MDVFFNEVVMKTFVIVDYANMFFRAKHNAGKGATLNEKIGLSIHILLNSVRSVWQRVDGTHCVFAMEGGSWRKAIYPEYKKNRLILKLKKTPKEIEEDELFFEAANELADYLRENTLSSVIKAEGAEGDDVIATFVKSHPNDKHIIVSTDTDFYQLLSDTVHIYDGMKGHYFTHNTITDIFTGKPVKDKDGTIKVLGDPEYILFEKCIRGDSSDNVFSAYPRIRRKSTKNIIGIDKVYIDRHTKGFDWNNVMQHTWTDHDGNEHLVLDDYHRNRTLIDLNNIPEDIVLNILQEIVKQQGHVVPMHTIGFQFMKLCAKFDLAALSKDASSYVGFLTARY